MSEEQKIENQPSEKCCSKKLSVLALIVSIVALGFSLCAYFGDKAPSQGGNKPVVISNGLNIEIKKDATTKEVLNISRLAVFIIAAIAFVLSLDENSSIFGLVSYAWAGFGATFGPLILLSLFWRGCTAKGAIAGLITGGVTVVAWHNIPASVCPIFGVYEILPAFILCLLVTVVVSLLDKNKDAQMLEEFDNFKKMPD